MAIAGKELEATLCLLTAIALHDLTDEIASAATSRSHVAPARGRSVIPSLGIISPQTRSPGPRDALSRSTPVTSVRVRGPGCRAGSGSRYPQVDLCEAPANIASSRPMVPDPRTSARSPQLNARMTVTSKGWEENTLLYTEGTDVALPPARQVLPAEKCGRLLAAGGSSPGLGCTSGCCAAFHAVGSVLQYFSEGVEDTRNRTRDVHLIADVADADLVARVGEAGLAARAVVPEGVGGEPQRHVGGKLNPCAPAVVGRLRVKDPRALTAWASQRLDRVVAEEPRPECWSHGR